MLKPELRACAAVPCPNFKPRPAARRLCLCLAALAALAGTAQAAELAGTPPQAVITPLTLAPLFGPRSDLLASSALGAVGGAVAAAEAATAAKPAPFEPPLFTGSNAHKYLGLGTLVLVGLTAATAPGEGCEHNCAANAPPRQTSGTPHTRFARAAAAMAAATVTTGLLAHWDDFHLKDGFADPDNQHVLLGLAGSVLMMYAVNKSVHSAVPTQHAAFAELGGVAMAVAVKLTW